MDSLRIVCASEAEYVAIYAAREREIQEPSKVWLEGWPVVKASNEWSSLQMAC